jgi:hypothetical protein
VFSFENFTCGAEQGFPGLASIYRDMNNQFVRVDLIYNYPDDSYEDEDGDTNYDFNEGSFGSIVISLDDPSVFVVVDNGENSIVEYYADGIASMLRENHGPGPYTLADVESDDIKEELSEIYRDDCRTIEAFVSVYVEYDGLTDRRKWVSVSDKLVDVVIEGIHPFGILTSMKRGGIL